ncbi:MAG: OmpA family protein [Bacteroidota bacterium]|nr:OmpA family protein [Bacteroidota bacterium]
MFNKHVSRVFLVIYLTLYGLLLNGQTTLPVKKDTITPSEAKKIVRQANKFYELGDYNAAMTEYALVEKYFANDPEFNHRFGVTLLHESFDRRKGIGHLFISANSGNVDAYRMIGWGCHLMSDFKEAKRFYKIYIVKSDTNSKTFKNSGIHKMLEETHNAEELENNPVDVTIENLGDMVNSSFPDYVPVITADDQNIYFTSRRESSTGGKVDHNKQFFEDIFHSEKDTATGRWKPAKHLHENVNSMGHDAIAGMSADGQTLLIYRNDEITGAGDIYVSFMRGEEWTIPKKLEGDVNLPESWEPSASLTANEDALYFSSNRNGGIGKSDIYMAKRMPNGTWGNPVNLGETINTIYDEDAPFIHPDGKTLYFASKGHKNMGGFDIFKSIKNDSGQWQKPVNLGYPINTTDDDIYFVMTANGKHGYYASMGKDSKGEKDIYMVTFKEEEKKLAVLKGKVTNEENKALASLIFVKKAESTKLNGLYNSNMNTGNYLIIMQPGNEFQVVFSSKGYISDTLIVNTKDVDSYNQIIRNVVLKKETSNEVKTVTNDSLASKPKPIETLVILKKEDQLKLLTKKENDSVNKKPITVLIDTTGKKDTIYTKKEEPILVSNSVKTIKSSKKQSDEVNYSKDCILDSTHNKYTISLNFGYKLEYLKSEQISALQKFYQPIRKKVVAIKINAHTDNKGSESYNLNLSQKRSDSVVRLLSLNGFKKQNMFACFFGKSRPVLPNENPDGSDNPDNRYRNRRVELQFVVKED